MYYDGLVGHVELNVRVSSVVKVALFNWHTQPGQEQVLCSELSLLEAPCLH